MTELLPMREQVARPAFQVGDHVRLKDCGPEYAGNVLGVHGDLVWLRFDSGQYTTAEKGALVASERSEESSPRQVEGESSRDGLDILALRAAPASPEGWVMVPRTSLQQIEDWFRDYERQHRAKCSAEGDAKALTNRDRADFIAAMIAAAPGVVGGGDRLGSSVAESGYDAPDGAASAGSEGSGAWRSMSELPARFRRLIALYNDGSGGRIYFHTEDGQIFDGEDGCEYTWGDRDQHTLWTYLPDGYRLWVEDCAEPMTFPDAPGEAASLADEPDRRSDHQSLTPLEKELVEALKGFDLKQEAVVAGTFDAITLRIPIVVLQRAAAALSRAESRQPEPRPDSKTLPVGRGER